MISCPETLPSIAETISARIEPHRIVIEEARRKLEDICVECGRCRNGAMKDDDRMLPFLCLEGAAPWLSPSDPRTPEMRVEIERAHAAIEQLMLQCIPWPHVNSNIALVSKAAGVWEKCICALRATGMYYGPLSGGGQTHPERLRLL